MEESFDCTKIIWGVAIVAYLYFQVKGRRVEKPQELENQPQEGSFTPEDMERIFREEKGDESEAVKLSMSQRPLSNRIGSKAPAPNFDESITINQPKVAKQKSVDFDLKKAVIMSEILTPKFKDQ